MARVSAAEAAKIDKIAVVACMVCPPPLELMTILGKSNEAHLLI
jgi:hypothetical protein